MRDLKLAWRNIWRNKRRTIITVASIFFGVILSTLMTSMQEGTYAKMIDNVVRFYSGYLQVHHPDYWETKSIDDLFVPDDSLMQQLSSTKHVQAAIPRLESFALLSYKHNTKGAMVIGVEPEKENQLTQLNHWVKQGTYLTAGGNGILVAVNLAKNLDVTLGDTLALIGQGYHGMSASGLFPVVGILEFPTPAMNNFGAYISLSRAQEFFSAPGRISSLVINVSGYDEVTPVKQSLVQALGQSLSVMTWDEMDPVTKQMIESDKGQGIIMKSILYILIGFGVFSTILMMISERMKELGIMVAVGMKKLRLATIVFYETMLIALVGLAAGFMASIPIIQFFIRNPIPLTGETAKVYEEFGLEPAIYFGSELYIFFNQLWIMLLISLLVSIYPVSKILRINVTKALHG